MHRSLWTIFAVALLATANACSGAEDDPESTAPTDAAPVADDSQLGYQTPPSGTLVYIEPNPPESGLPTVYGWVPGEDPYPILDEPIFERRWGVGPFDGERLAWYTDSRVLVRDVASGVDAVVFEFDDAVYDEINPMNVPPENSARVVPVAWDGDDLLVMRWTEEVGPQIIESLDIDSGQMHDSVLIEQVPAYVRWFHGADAQGNVYVAAEEYFQLWRADRAGQTEVAIDLTDLDLSELEQGLGYQLDFTAAVSPDGRYACLAAPAVYDPEDFSGYYGTTRQTRTGNLIVDLQEQSVVHVDESEDAGCVALTDSGYLLRNGLLSDEAKTLTFITYQGDRLWEVEEPASLAGAAVVDYLP
jgi:hypothetical protein